MKISTILDHIDSGHMALPEFQRGYVWNREQVRGLMRSLYQRYPVGSLLVWVTDSDSAIHRGEVMNLAPGVVKLLLDGQQRITTLYGIMRGQVPRFFDGHSDTFTGLYFHLDAEEFSFYMPTKMGHDPLWIDVTSLMKNGSDGLGHIIQGFTQSPELLKKIGLYSPRLSRLLGIAEIDLHIEEITGQDKSLPVVVEIFNRVNSGGTKLSRGDLALAKISASWPEARADMKTNLNSWAQAGLNFDLDWQLRVLNVILTGEAKFEYLHNSTRTEVEAALKTTKKTVDYLLNIIADRLGLDHDRVLFGRYAFPVMARYVAQKNGFIEDGYTQNKLLFWYLQAALWGRYSGSTESVIDTDLALIEETEGALDRLLNELHLVRGGFKVLPDHFGSWGLGARFFPLLYLLTRTGQARDWGHGLALKNSLLGHGSRLEIHHIFPKSLLYKHDYKKSEVNAIANYCFLTQQTNNAIISNRNPEEYFYDVEEKFPGALASQWVPMDPSLWKVEHYLDFLSARRELLAQAADNFFNSLLPGYVSWQASEAAKLPELALPTDDEQGQTAEELITMLQSWLSANNLPPGESDFELTNAANGSTVAIFDLAWPKGLQEGMDTPIGLLLQNHASNADAIALQGFRSFSSVSAFKTHIQRTVLGQISVG